MRIFTTKTFDKLFQKLDIKIQKKAADIPPDKTVQDFLDEFEQKYQMSSDEFYELYEKGQTEDTPDLNDWALFCSLKLTLEEKAEDSSKVTFKPQKIEKMYA